MHDDTGDRHAPGEDASTRLSGWLGPTGRGPRLAVSALDLVPVLAGAATPTAAPPDVDAVVTAADDATYDQKRAGENGVRVVAR